MSIFDDHITDETNLQKFYNFVKKSIEDSFIDTYRYYNKDLDIVESAYNKLFNDAGWEFAEHEIYHPYLTCAVMVDVKSAKVTKILVTIVYGEDKEVFVFNEEKIFMQLVIDIPEEVNPFYN